VSSTKKVFGKRFCIFIIFEAIAIYAALFCWGFTGKVDSKRFHYMVKFMSSTQKEQLATALNFYYDHGIAKYSKGLVLKCNADTDSIIKQFSWFHRNAITYYLASAPDYHDILLSTVDYFEIGENEDLEKLSSSRLESKIIYWQNQQNTDTMTSKDKNDMLITLVDLGGSLFLSTTSPIGLSISAAALLSKAGSDPAKSVPAIVVFHKIRSQNLMITLLLFSALSFILPCLMIRRK